MSAPSQPRHPAPPHGGLASVFAQHRGELLRFLRARCGNSADADDLLQDLWIRITTTEGRSGPGPAPGPIANPRAYLFRMANNLVLDGVRSRQRGMARDRGWLDVLGRADVPPQHIADPAISADDALARAQEIALLAGAIDALPPGAARALRLHRIDGLRHEEVAQIMGISRSGVEKHLALAMKRLRESLVNCGLFAGVASLPAEHRHGEPERAEPEA